MPGLHGVGGGGIFVTKFYFIENQGILIHGNILFANYKTFDILPPSVFPKC